MVLNLIGTQQCGEQPDLGPVAALKSKSFGLSYKQNEWGEKIKSPGFGSGKASVWVGTVTAPYLQSGKWPSLNTKLEPCHLFPFFQICFYLEQVIWYIRICIVTVPRSLCPLLKKHDMEWKVKTLRCIDFLKKKRGGGRSRSVRRFQAQKRILP